MPKPFRGARTRVAAIAVLALATAAIGAAPAQASTFIRTGTAVTDDYALAEIWGFNWHRHGAWIQGAVWDRCGADGEGDGAGAYLRAQVKFANGTWSSWTPFEGDSTGCHNAGVGWSHVFDYPNRTVVALKLHLCERDDGVAIECTSRTFDNPTVG